MTRHAETPIRWLVRPADADDAMARAILSLAASTPPELSGWSAVSTSSARGVFRRAAADHADYLKFFPEDRFSIRRRSGLSIWPTPAGRHVEWTRRLGSLGVRVAPLVAAGELPAKVPLRQPASFIVTRSPIGARTVERALAEGDLASVHRVRLAADLLSLARRLHAGGIGRIDLRASNVLIYSTEEPLVLFDIDRFIRLGVLGRRGRMKKDLERARATRARLLDGTGVSLDEL